MLNLQPDLNGALFFIANIVKFYLLTHVNRNEKKAGVEGGNSCPNP